MVQQYMLAAPFSKFGKFSNMYFDYCYLPNVSLLLFNMYFLLTWDEVGHVKIGRNLDAANKSISLKCNKYRVVMHG